MRHLDLFSGIGGFALAARWTGFTTIGFCEIDKYCQQVLTKNFLADAEHSGCEGGRKHQITNRGEANAATPSCKIVSDIRELNGADFPCDLITGGFPCQPFSCAGKRRGKEDDRYLWPEMLRVISEARPAWVLGENVTGIIGMELDSVLSDLEAIGYACRPFVIPACGVDAMHRRSRVWIVAHSNDSSGARLGQHSRAILSKQETTRPSSSSSSSADSVLPRLPQFNGAEHSGPESRGKLAGSEPIRTHSANGAQQWLPEPNVGRVANGVPRRVDRLRGLGNSIVPQVAYQIFLAIKQSEQGSEVPTVHEACGRT